MAHTKSGGSTKLGRDSASQRLGVKINHGGKVSAGEVIIRQRGTKYLHGKNTALGGDDTIYAKIDGRVKMTDIKKIRFDGSTRRAKKVSIIASAEMIRQ